MTTDFEPFAHIATIVASIVGAGALVFAAIQLRNSAKIAEGQFLLALESMLSMHDEVHMKLRPGGDWSKGEEPKTNMRSSKTHNSSRTVSPGDTGSK